MSLESADKIARSSRTDIFLGVVAPVGVRRDAFEAKLQACLERYGYKLELWHISDFLEDFKGIRVDESSGNERLRTAMNAGTKLRTDVSEDVLARAGLLAVNQWRETRDPDKPTAHLFWSLKHPEEVATLRLVYGGGFHLIGLYATEEERVTELRNRRGISNVEARDHIARDRDESGNGHGQRTRDTFQLADVFIPWGGHPDEAALERFLELLFGRPTLTPTEDEHRMFLAYASGLRSGELSRQVGAALVSAQGDVIAVGANDVPRRGGGLYAPGADDDRDAVRRFDSNARVRREIMNDVAKQLDVGSVDDVSEKLEQTRLREITEYGRAVHAEMEALLSCARSGRTTRNATLYVTTYPCHNCARHIIAAGLDRVVYVEPYPKSKALELHDKDVIEVPPGTSGDGSGKVRFEPHLGVGPRRFFDYFSISLGDGYVLKRKEESGNVTEWEPSGAAPRISLSEEAFTETEKNLAGELLPYRLDKT